MHVAPHKKNKNYCYSYMIVGKITTYSCKNMMCSVCYLMEFLRVVMGLLRVQKSHKKLRNTFLLKRLDFTSEYYGVDHIYLFFLLKN